MSLPFAQIILIDFQTLLLSSIVKFLIMMFIMMFVMMFIVFAREFAKEKARQTKSGEFHKIREKLIVEDAVKGYLDWINQAGKYPLLSLLLLFQFF